MAGAGFVMEVARARAAALQHGVGLVEVDGDAVWVEHHDGQWAVEPAVLFTDGGLAERVADLLDRHG